MSNNNDNSNNSNAVLRYINILTLIIFLSEDDGMACNGFMWLRKGQMAGSYKQANELSGFHKVRENLKYFVILLNTSQEGFLSKKSVN